MAEVPCDICRSQDHDYRHCQAGALPDSYNQIIKGVREGPCSWCEKKGHISLECPAANDGRGSPRGKRGVLPVKLTDSP